MAEWKRYQETTAKLFRELGCDVETDFEVQGVRGKHLLDVSVRFSRFGLKQHWLVECKLWKRPVPKEKVLALKSIVEDIGADRGILIAEAGYQSGAHAASRLTNVTLISLAELRDAAKEELLSLGLQEIQRRAAEMKNCALSLWEWERHEAGFSSSKLRPGISATLATKVGGSASVIGMGAEQAQLGAFPAPLRFLDDGNTLIRAKDLEDFVISASEILNAIEPQFVELKRQAASSP